MSINQEISAYIESQPEPKRGDMQLLHNFVITKFRDCKLWFLDGRNSANKIVSNPNIGYGSYSIQYTNGETKEFYQVGISANTTGISVYIMGLKDKTYLSATYGKQIGKASVTGYCIKFKALKDINLTVLEAAMKYGFNATKKMK